MTEPHSCTLPGQRIAVIGVTGSGKTTLARQLSARLGIAHVEMDALHFGENWSELPEAEFRARVQNATAGPAWITDGNYSAVRDLIWGRADTLIWLDYSLAFVLARLTRRTFKRIFTHERLWHGNVETFAGQFLSKDSLFVWLLKTYPKRKREYSQALSDPQRSHLRRVRLTSARQTAAWLAQVPAALPRRYHALKGP